MSVNFDFYDESGFKILSPDNAIFQRVFRYSFGFFDTLVTTKVPLFYGNTNVSFKIYSRGVLDAPPNWQEYNSISDITTISGSDDILYFASRTGMAVENVTKTNTVSTGYLSHVWDAELKDYSYFYVQNEQGDITWSFERIKQAPYVAKILEVTPNTLYEFTSANNRRLHLINSNIPGVANKSGNTVSEWSGLAVKWFNNGRTVRFGYMGENYPVAKGNIAMNGGKIKIILLEYVAGD